MLKLFYETKDAIPNGAEEFYAEKDGKFLLQADGIKTDDDVSNLQGALEKERKLRRDAETKLKDYSKFDLLPDDFDISEFNRLKDSQTGEIENKLKEQRERIVAQHEKELASYKEKLEQANGLVNTHVKTANLRKAMAEANINKAFMPAVEAMMQSKITIEGTDVYLNEKPLADALKDWASTDEGKHYVSAPANTGGGVDAKSSASGVKKTMERSQFEALDAGQKMEVVKNGVQLT